MAESREMDENLHDYDKSANLDAKIVSICVSPGFVGSTDPGEVS
jgi:hypothetical protein